MKTFKSLLCASPVAPGNWQAIRRWVQDVLLDCLASNLTLHGPGDLVQVLRSVCLDVLSLQNGSGDRVSHMRLL